MDEREITYDDLLDGDDPAAVVVPKTLAELLANGFPRQGDVTTLAAIVRLDDPSSALRGVQRSYRDLLDKQTRARSGPT